MKTDGEGVIDLRSGFIEEIEEYCSDPFEKCCSFEKVLNASKIANEFNDTKISREYFSRRNRNGVMDLKQNKNIKSSKVLLGEFPWMVAIMEGENNFIGGGSLLRDFVVLTG